MVICVYFVVPNMCYRNRNYRKAYKTCFVPLCKSTTISTPDKVFVAVPINLKVRKKWFKSVRRECCVSYTNTSFYCCLDHFKLEEDFANTVKHTLTGCRLIPKEGVLPRIFDCQPDRTRAHSSVQRHVFAERNRRALVESIMGVHEGRGAAQQQTHSSEHPKVELEDIGPFSESCVDPLSNLKTEVVYQEYDTHMDPLSNLETEGVCREYARHVGSLSNLKTEGVYQEYTTTSVLGSVKEEPQLTAADSAAICSIKAEPPSITDGAAEGQHQDFQWTFPASNDAKDCKPHQHPGIEGICHQGPTEIYHGRDKSNEYEMPRQVPVCRDKEGREPVSPNSGAGVTRGLNQGTSVKVETDLPQCENAGVKSDCSLESEILDLSHDGEDISERNMWQMQFRQKNQITNHINLGKFHCNVCRKQFGTHSDMALHNMVHTGEVPFTCDVCGEQFPTYTLLTRHTRVHAGGQPIKCDVCNKLFVKSSDLVVHSRVHTGDRPFKCDVCSKQFTRPSHLTLHSRVHTGERPYKCEVCGKRFTLSCNLTVHTRIHTSEKPFECFGCSKRFARSSSLAVHCRTHTGYKPFKCDLCNKMFCTSSWLTRHTSIHSGNKILGV